MGKGICNLSIVLAAIYFADKKMKDEVIKIKEKVY